MNLHWDGNNVSLEERNRSAAMGTGITPPTGDRQSLKRVADWLRNLAAPPYPFKIDKDLAGQGAPIYKNYCAGCHGADGKDFRGEYAGKVVPIGDIGTDEHRLDSYTYDVAVNQNMIFAGYENERFQPLPQNLRLCQQPARRALAAGAVSAQRFGADLARPARAQRQTAQEFLSRLRCLRSEKSRLCCPMSREEQDRPYFLYNTDEPGNSNKGHEGKALWHRALGRQKKTLWSSISRLFKRAADGAPADKES